MSLLEGLKWHTLVVEAQLSKPRRGIQQIDKEFQGSAIVDQKQSGCRRKLGPNLQEPANSSKSLKQLGAYFEDFAAIAGIELVLINEDTKLYNFKKELQWGEVYYQLNKS